MNSLNAHTKYSRKVNLESLIKVWVGVLEHIAAYCGA